MNILAKTGIPVKQKGDGIKVEEFNTLNSTVNSLVDAVNYLLKSFCNVNSEVNDWTREFTLQEAIGLVPESRRQPGIRVMFLSEDGIYLEYVYNYQYTSSDYWNNLDNWSIAINQIDGGTW